MTADMDPLDKALLLALPVGEGIVLGCLIIRKLWRTLPVFTIYLGWGLISDSVLYYILNSVPSVYPRFYTVQTIVDSCLMFIVLLELCWLVLRPVRASLPRATLFIIAGMIGVACLVIWPLAAKISPPKMDASSLLIFHLQQTFAILRVLFFLVVAGFSQLLSIGWRDRELQVISGLGLYAIVTLLVMLLHVNEPSAATDKYHHLDQIVSFSYLGTLSYWVLCFSAKELKRKEFSPQMQHLLLQIGGGARAGRIALTDLPSERSRKKD